MSKGGPFVTASEYTEVEINVDLAEVIGDLSAKEKAQVMRLCGASDAASDDLYVRRAYEALMANRPNEALAYLENYLHPAIGGNFGRKKEKAAA